MPTVKSASIKFGSRPVSVCRRSFETWNRSFHPTTGLSLPPTSPLGRRHNRWLARRKTRRLSSRSLMPTGITTPARTSRPRSCGTSSPMRRRNHRRCSIPATRRLIHNSSGRARMKQDREPLEVDIVPIYIQEVIEPRVIVEAIQTQKPNKPKNSGFLPGFFDDFDELEFDRKIEFYQHDQKWANRMILGNSLHVMTSLAEKEGLKGKVQMIYIDPPYGIKFGSNWQVSTRRRDVKDGKAEDATRQPEQIRERK